MGDAPTVALNFSAKLDRDMPARSASSRQGVPVRDIAAVIGRRLSVPVVGKSAEAAADHFGFLARFLAMDCPASSAQTQERLGWRPTRPGLIADLDHGRYFET